MKKPMRKKSLYLSNDADCGYCKSYASKIIIDKKWQKGFSIFLRDELNKRLE